MRQVQRVGADVRARDEVEMRQTAVRVNGCEDRREEAKTTGKRRVDDGGGH